MVLFNADLFLGPRMKRVCNMIEWGKTPIKEKCSPIMKDD